MKSNLVFKNFLALSSRVLFCLGVMFFIAQEIEGAGLGKEGSRFISKFFRLARFNTTRFANKSLAPALRSDYRYNQHNTKSPLMGLFGFGGVGTVLLKNEDELKMAADSESQERQKVAIWLRKYVNPAAPEATKKKELDETSSYVNGLISELRQGGIEPVIMIATKPNDAMFDIQLDVNPENLRMVPFSNMESFSGALNELIKHTPAGLPVLTISPGVTLSLSSSSLVGFKSLVTEALESINESELSEKKRVYAYGWQIDYGKFDQFQHFAACHQGGNWCTSWEMNSYRNDGSDLGKGWYNTCALLSPRFLEVLKKDPIPEWVDNGNAGELNILNGITGQLHKAPIGGVEELAMMHKAIKADSGATFVLDTTHDVFPGVKTGTGPVTFDLKLLRKVGVGHFYEKQKLQPGNEDIVDLQAHMLVIERDSIEPVVLPAI